jgi:hypothetical protein
MLGHAQLYHARDLRERRRGEGAEHRSPDVVRGDKRLPFCSVRRERGRHEAETLAKNNVLDNLKS